MVVTELLFGREEGRERGKSRSSSTSTTPPPSLSPTLLTPPHPQDHAILQCNLFLGLGLDAYIAIGRLPGGVQQHVWVVTREPNGDILFWETTKGDFYTLPGRWTGLYLEGAAEAMQFGGMGGEEEQDDTGGLARLTQAKAQRHVLHV